MINELYQLSASMSSISIRPENWHAKYKLLPKITEKAPCIRIVVKGGQITYLENVDVELGKVLRKYGSNQGTFPAMNLASLYRIENAEDSEKLRELLKGKVEQIDVQQIKKWCVKDNWSDKFLKKFRMCMQKVPDELEQLLQGEAVCDSVSQLIRAVQIFAEPEILRSELERKAFELIERRSNIRLALQILFYVNEKKNDCGSLSVIFDSEELEDDGNSSASIQFVKSFNEALLKAGQGQKQEEEISGLDAFGQPFIPIEDPMPSVKLSGGFDVSLRTMFEGQPCQMRYGRIGNDTYPVSSKMRVQLKMALEWLSNERMEGKTWVRTDTNEILFAYPSKLTELSSELVSQFCNAKSPQGRFEAAAKSFLKYITDLKETDPQNYPDNIQIFMIRKLDKARAKVIYTRCASPENIIWQCGKWQKAAGNIPNLRKIKNPKIPYPVDVAAILNRVWKQNDMHVLDKLKIVPNYHGMELLFGVGRQVLERDLHLLLAQCSGMQACAGRMINNVITHEAKEYFILKLQDVWVLLGMVLYWLESEKEDYMNAYPFLLGQLLKISDSLHELYCFKVREQQIPTQLVGNSLYVTASEMPVQAFDQLSKRMMPYITWAKANRDARVETTYKDSKGEEKTLRGLSAGYLLSAYGRTATQLSRVFDDRKRFNDIEKAQLFIGYLADFPQIEKLNDAQDINTGGTNNG